MILKYPASWFNNQWRDALPSGNGIIGAAVYGSIYDETILINHQDLWHGGQKGSLPDVSYTLAKTRNLMNQGKYHEANWILANELKEQGYHSRFSTPLPLADLKLKMPVKHGFSNYRRILDMETGEISVKWEEKKTTYQRDLFVSRADNIIVYRLQGTEPLDCDLSLTLHDQDHSMKNEYEKSLTVNAQDQFLYYAVGHQNGTDFGAVMRLINQGGTIAAVDQNLLVHNADQVLVLVKVFVSGEHKKAWRQYKQELNLEHRAYDQLLTAHTKIHKPIFNSVKIQLAANPSRNSNEELLLKAYTGQAPLELIEKLWAYGRYLFISSVCETGLPCHMYGLWTGTYRAMWSHFMANENVQMIYWHALSGNVAFAIPAVYDYYARMMVQFRENARKLFGCRGIYIPAGTTPGLGLPSQIVPVILNWTGAAGWLAQHFYNYWLYTGDQEFLREKALPFMRETAHFYEDFLEEGEDGYYQIYPSVSPENSPENYITEQAKALGHPMPSTINATMECAIIKELLTNLIEGSKAVSIYGDEIDKWQAMLAKIPAYRINQDGAVSEWMHPDFRDNYHHRHLSHLYPVFPGQEVVKEQDSRLFAAFAKAVEQRLVVGIKDQSGWSLAHMANIYARLNNGDQALECLNLLARSCVINNFFTLHNDWRRMGITMGIKSAPIQIDANLGWTNAVQEMLMYSSPYLVKILPACPRAWQQGSVEGLCFTTGEVDFAWDQQKQEFHCLITAKRATNITLTLPDGYGNYDFACDRGSVKFIAAGDCWQVLLPAGAQLKISSHS